MSKSPVLFRTDRRPTPTQLQHLFQSSGITRPTDDLARLAKMIGHSDLCLTAWHGDRLVGVARAITDFSYCCYLSDLAIDREFQCRGIGKRLVEMLREQLGDEVAVILVAGAGAEGYYGKIGFEPIPSAWRMPRKR